MQQRSKNLDAVYVIANILLVYNYFFIWLAVANIDSKYPVWSAIFLKPVAWILECSGWLFLLYHLVVDTTLFVLIKRREKRGYHSKWDAFVSGVQMVKYFLLLIVLMIFLLFFIADHQSPSGHGIRPWT